MDAFELVAPGTLEEALGLRERHGGDSMLLAGGQSLLILLRQRLVAPDPLVSLGRIAELRDVAAGEDGLVIGAMVTYAEATRSVVLRERAPLLAEAAGRVGSIHIRNLGTVGGSLGHADPAADVPVALMTLDARVRLASASGAREVPVADLYTGNLFETVVADTEILTQVSVPAAAAVATHGYRRFSYREGEYPQCQAAVRLEWSGGTCSGARVVVGGGGPCPRRLPALESWLVGRSETGSDLADAVHAATADLDPLADVRGGVDWKRQVVRHVVTGSVENAMGRGGHA